MGAACRLLPHGGYALIPIVFTTCAWVMSIFQDGCDYAIVKGPIVQTMTGDSKIPFVEVGFAAYRKPEVDPKTREYAITYSGRCTDYDPARMPFDSARKAAKGFAFLALVLGGGGALFLWFSACCVFSKATWRWAGYEILLAAIFQVMAFIWYDNELCQNQNSCSLSWGSKADIVSSVFWCFAAFCILCKYPTPKRVNAITETTQPEIAITDNTHIDLPSPSDDLPLHGDATAILPSTSMKTGFKDGKELKNVEVI